MTTYPRRVWFHTGNGWASREIMPPDHARRKVINHILGDRDFDHGTGKPRRLMPGELEEMNDEADKLRGYCHLNEQSNAALS
jgi:hypothetical protein